MVYSPFLPTLHTTVVRRDLARASALWREADFLLRVGLSAVGTGGGILLLLLADRLAALRPKGWQILPGLERDRRF